MGRPASINNLDVDILEPSDNKFLKASVELSRISQKVHYQYAQSSGSSVAEICTRVRDINTHLFNFHDNLDPEIKFPLSKLELETSLAKLNIEQFTLAIRKSKHQTCSLE
jgi:hypothetical protein